MHLLYRTEIITWLGLPARTYLQSQCEDRGCSPEDLTEAMNDREKWRETVRDIRVPAWLDDDDDDDFPQTIW